MPKLKKNIQNTETVIQSCPVKKIFVEILQNTQKNIYAGVSL